MFQFMFKILGRLVIVALGLACLIWLAWALYSRLTSKEEERTRDRLPAPVEVSTIERGTIRLMRDFSGAIESRSSFSISAEVSGRVRKVNVDMGDEVQQGQVVAVLDDEEYREELAQAKANLTVAEANLVEAGSALKISYRTLQRAQQLFAKKILSESDLDDARNEQAAAEAMMQVAKARVDRDKAALKSAELEVSRCQVRATWEKTDGDKRVVAERHVDEGQVVAENAAIVSLVQLSPINGIIYATERDYGMLSTGQVVELRTDAYPEEKFTGQVSRISPVFRENSRQARIELLLENDDEKLKPGMFARARIQLKEVSDAKIIPESALTNRDGQEGVYVLQDDGKTVAWRTVRTGIREGKRVQVFADNLQDKVITMGQHLLNDGAKVKVTKPDISEEPITPTESPEGGKALQMPQS